jgi:hypothetical protein
MVKLAPCQLAALAHVNARARDRRIEAVATLAHIQQMCNLPADLMERVGGAIWRNARVALHFHPDRPVSNGTTVSEALLEEGTYRNQFETGISNGGVTAFLGGSRDICEHHLFGGSYHAPGVEVSDRPRYGALDLLGHSEGPSPRFGSCYFVLTAAVSRRCTFTYQDSHSSPNEIGTLQEFDDVLAALLRDVFYYDGALGERDLTVERLCASMERALVNPVAQRALTGPPFRNLNQYIEAQVHGEVSLASDTDALVVDPSFRGTTTGDRLFELCRRYQIELQWHHGFCLRVEDVPHDFRGPTMPSLAERVARERVLDASVIGSAARDLFANPDGWKDRGTPAEILQELKLLWHVLVRYGAPMRADESSGSR